MNITNIKSISYDFKEKSVIIELKQAETINGFNTKHVKQKCDYEKYCDYVSKWLKVVN